MLDALGTAGSFEHTFLIVTSDHSGHERTHGTSMPEDVTVPWVVSVLGVPSGLSLTDRVSITDTAPTIAALLGIDRPEEWTGCIIGEVVRHA